MSLIITKYCSINEARIIKNDHAIIENEGKLDFKKFIRASYKHLNVDYPKFFKMDSLSKLGFLSVEVLLQEENLLNKYPSEKIGIVLSNASSSLETDKKPTKCGFLCLGRTRTDGFEPPTTWFAAN